MNVFLSYAAEQRDLAERIALALRAQGHRVYFDKDDIREGELVHAAIREQIERSDYFIFLLSPGSVTPGRYPLAELSLAKRKWKNPVDYVLPVLAAHVPSKDWPPYLRALSGLRSHIEIGTDPVADICRVVSQQSGQTPWAQYVRYGGGVLALAGFIGATVYFIGVSQEVPGPSAVSPEFEIRGDNANGTQGGTVTLGVHETRPGIVANYSCRVDWQRGGNIRAVDYDDCEKIVVALSDGPFVNPPGRASGLLENMGMIAETLRIVVVDSSGRDVWQRDATIRLRKGNPR